MLFTHEKSLWFKAGWENIVSNDSRFSFFSTLKTTLVQENDLKADSDQVTDLQTTSVNGHFKNK